MKEILSSPEKTQRKTQKENLVLWKKGESGNPTGRPKGSRNFETDFLEMLRKSGYTEDDFQKKYIEQLMARPEMMQDVMNRLYGKSKGDNEGIENIQNNLIIGDSDRLNSIYSQMLLGKISL